LNNKLRSSFKKQQNTKVTRSKRFQVSKSITKHKSLINMKWKKGNLQSFDKYLKFVSVQLPDNISSLDSQLEFFSYFFDKDLMEKIMKEIELYSVQKNCNKPVNLSLVELKRYLGILIYSSIFQVPNVRDYWSIELEFKISHSMAVNRFEKFESFYILIMTLIAYLGLM
jgi:hypothetical protein